MVKRFLGMLSLTAFVLSVMGCGSSSTSEANDECAKDPTAPTCIQEDPAEDPVAL